MNLLFWLFVLAADNKRTCLARAPSKLPHLLRELSAAAAAAPPYVFFNFTLNTKVKSIEKIKTLFSSFFFFYLRLKWFGVMGLGGEHSKELEDKERQKELVGPPIDLQRIGRTVSPGWPAPLSFSLCPAIRLHRIQRRESVLSSTYTWVYRIDLLSSSLFIGCLPSTVNERRAAILVFYILRAPVRFASFLFFCFSLQLREPILISSAVVLLQTAL